MGQPSAVEVEPSADEPCADEPCADEPSADEPSADEAPIERRVSSAAWARVLDAIPRSGRASLRPSPSKATPHASGGGGGSSGSSDGDAGGSGRASFSGPQPTIGPPEGNGTAMFAAMLAREASILAVHRRVHNEMAQRLPSPRADEGAANGGGDSDGEWDLSI